MSESQVLVKRLRDVLAVIASETLPPAAVQSLAALAVAAADAQLDNVDARPGVRVVRPS